MNRIRLFVFLTSGMLLGACTGTSAQETSALAATETSAPSPEILKVMTHDSFAASEEVIQRFEQDQDVDVQFLEAGDAGSALNQAILSRGNPLADVFYGVDNTFLSRALKEDIFQPYRSPLLESIPDQFEMDPESRALPVDYGDVCLNYDVAYFEREGLAPPESLDDLLEPRYQDLLVTENPATSSPGLAFLLATIGNFGEDGYLPYWEGLIANGAQVAPDWETAYYSDFSLSGGQYPLVVSYGSSPPAEVYFAEEPLERAPSGVVASQRSCFRQVEFVGILRGTDKQELAEAWIDFMLSATFQEDMPLNMFVYPVNEDARLPQVFVDHLVRPDETAEVSPDEITANREAWIEAWRDSVLR